MSEVVINSCYGGFSLSEKAIRRYSDIKNLGLIGEKNERFKSINMIYKKPDGEYWSDSEIPRGDPDLIAVVRELGREANGNRASLKIVDVPSGSHYRIGEYDGTEWIEKRDDIEWIVAP